MYFPARSKLYNELPNGIELLCFNSRKGRRLVTTIAFFIFLFKKEKYENSYFF